MAALAPENTHRLVEEILQSPPVDATLPYDASTLAGKTIVVTGGASGIGAALARRWARHGAFLAVGDLDADAGEALVAELRASAADADTPRQEHFFQRCDVTDWASQVAFFRAAAAASPTGVIHAVVPAAGVAELATTASGRGFENPSPTLGDPDGDGGPPEPPSLRVLDVNLTGVLYSVHLALYWLGRSPAAAAAATAAAAGSPDRHILLVGSASGLLPLPGQPLYCAAKHGLTGLFRSLRCTAWRHGRVRVNMVCPYFVDTPLVPAGGMALLAGAGLAALADVVDAGTRLAADEGVRGRALVVGPRVRVGDDGGAVEYVEDAGDDGDGDGDGNMGGKAKVGGGGAGQAVWECYAHDYDSVEAFVWRYTRLLNTVERIRGWTGWARDMIYIWFYRSKPKKGGNDAKKQR